VDCSLTPCPGRSAVSCVYRISVGGTEVATLGSRAGGGCTNFSGTGSRKKGDGGELRLSLEREGLGVWKETGSAAAPMGGVSEGLKERDGAWGRGRDEADDEATRRRKKTGSAAAPMGGVSEGLKEGDGA